MFSWWKIVFLFRFFSQNFLWVPAYISTLLSQAFLVSSIVVYFVPQYFFSVHFFFHLSKPVLCPPRPFFSPSVLHTFYMLMSNMADDKQRRKSSLFSAKASPWICFKDFIIFFISVCLFAEFVWFPFGNQTDNTNEVPCSWESMEHSWEVRYRLAGLFYDHRFEFINHQGSFSSYVFFEAREVACNSAQSDTYPLVRTQGLLWPRERDVATTVCGGGQDRLQVHRSTGPQRLRSASLLPLRWLWWRRRTVFF